MNTAKIYYDSEGNERSIYWMVKHEPQWAANRIQAGEVAIEKLAQLQNTLSNSEYNPSVAQLKQFHEQIMKQKDLEPEIKTIVNDNFWDLV